MTIVIIDAQGGGIGKLLVAGLKKALPEALIWAVGTNAAATGAMLAAALESEPALELQEKFIDGINAQTLKLLHLFLFGRSHANFIEVLGCSGGCQNGPCSLSIPN